MQGTNSETVNERQNLRQALLMVNAYSKPARMDQQRHGAGLSNPVRLANFITQLPSSHNTLGALEPSG